MRREEPTEFQRKLATALAIEISGNSRAVVAEKLMAAVAPAVLEDSRPATPKQIAFARKLGFDVSEDSMAVANARISTALEVQNIEALENLQLRPGDAVKIKGLRTNSIVSSVGRNRRVFLKGRGGESIWPSQIVHVVKRAPN